MSLCKYRDKYYGLLSVFCSAFQDIMCGNDSIYCRWRGIIIGIQLTLLPLLPEWHHLVELSLYQPVSLLLIQPFATREGLLYPCERTVHHHLGTTVTQLNELPANYQIGACAYVCVFVPSRSTTRRWLHRCRVQWWLCWWDWGAQKSQH